MSVTALHLYAQLTETTDERVKAKIIAEAFAQIEDRFPNLKEVATEQHVREGELRLQKEIRETELRLRKDIENVRLEIEGVRLETREVELRLHKEIEGVRLEIKQVEGKLGKEIKEVEGRLGKEIEGIRLEIKEVEGRLRKEIKEVEVKVAETRADLIRWVVGVGLLQSSLIVGVLLKIAHLI